MDRLYPAFQSLYPIAGAKRVADIFSSLPLISTTWPRAFVRFGHWPVATVLGTSSSSVVSFSMSPYFSRYSSSISSVTVAPPWYRMVGKFVLNERAYTQAGVAKSLYSMYFRRNEKGRNEYRQPAELDLEP